MGTAELSAGVKPATHFHLVEINTVCSCTSTHPACLHVVNRNNLSTNTHTHTHTHTPNNSTPFC